MNSQGKEMENVVKFKWGRKRGTGGIDKNCQFYESFTYDGTEYFLYDSIYLFKDGEDPYIGKLAKIWLNTSTQRKMIKVVWFFQPTDISNWLEDINVHEKELFLACGDGPGLSSINPLEVIIGRCKVVCTSKDKRNAQPLDEDVELADYLFYRTFNVDNFVISENIDDKIAGIAVENFFNKGAARSGEKSNKSLSNDKTTEMLTKVDLLRGPVGLGTHSSSGDSVKGPALKIEENYDLHHSSVVDKEKKRVVSFLDENKVNDRSTSDALVQKPLKKSKLLDNTTMSKEQDLHRYAVEENYDLHHKTVVDKERKRVVSFLDENKVNDGSTSDALEQKPLKKSRLLDNATMIKEQDLLRNAKPIEAPRKPIYSEERRKWFNKDIGWEAKMKEAQKKGTLVLLENLDPSYTHSEVENIMDNYLSEKVQAKMVDLAVHSNPFSGQAFVILNSVDAAKKVLKRLDEGCLMLPNARPLVCRRVASDSQVQQSKFLGHYTIDKMRRKPQTDDFRNAVSTSHCSQPNTIEYEMAMEWRLLQENFLTSLTELFKQQKAEVGRLWTNLKNKY